LKLDGKDTRKLLDFKVRLKKMFGSKIKNFFLLSIYVIFSHRKIKSKHCFMYVPMRWLSARHGFIPKQGQIL